MGHSSAPRPGDESGGASHPSQRARRRRVAARRLARSARILVCECDLTAHPAIGDVVLTLGYEVTAHHSVADTLREATTGSFAAIVLSIPALSDEKLGLLQVLRRATPQVPLVIVTSDGSLEMRRRCQVARPYYYSVRPIDAGELRSVLAGAVESGGAAG